jgi:hypothetical protein
MDEYCVQQFVLNRWLVGRKDDLIDIILKNLLTSIFTLADATKMPKNSEFQKISID